MSDISDEELTSLSDEVTFYDPLLALKGGVNGLDAYNSLLSRVSVILNPKGRVVLEIGQGQEKDVDMIAKRLDFCLESATKDLGGITRCLVFKK